MKNLKKLPDNLLQAQSDSKSLNLPIQVWFDFMRCIFLVDLVVKMLRPLVENLMWNFLLEIGSHLSYVATMVIGEIMAAS